MSKVCRVVSRTFTTSGAGRDFTPIRSEFGLHEDFPAGALVDPVVGAADEHAMLRPRTSTATGVNSVWTANLRILCLRASFTPR